MTIPPTSATPEPTSAGAQACEATGENLGWLLDNFLREVPGADAAVLASRDGLPLASAGLQADERDQIAAVAASLYSSGRTAGNITDPPGGDVQLLLIHLDRRYLFLMSTQRPGTVAASPAVGTLLTVLAAGDVDTRMVGRQMSALIIGVAEHLSTKARTGAGSGDDR